MSVFRLPKPELRATIHYLTEEEGGRRSPIFSGYRGQFYYDGRDWDAAQEFIGTNTALLGEITDCYLQTLSPQYHQHKFYIGKEFEIREGAKIVGRGIITEILREDFVALDE